MIYQFDDFALDTALIELRKNDQRIAIEPQVFALLAFLIENRDRVVGKDDIIRHVWGGRAISDSAISSRIKSIRHVLGDTGRTQKFLRTIHGIGFRFVRDVTLPSATPTGPQPEVPADTSACAPGSDGRPSIAIIPFRRLTAEDPRSQIADALPQDLITGLSRLRWLFVIARGSSFQFRDENPDLERIRNELGVRYCLSGSVELAGRTMVVSTELCDLDDRGIVWSEKFQGPVGAIHEIREEIVRSVVNALELRIPLNEVRRAQFRAPDRLDAWSTYHMGLHHMYRFSKIDNRAAAELFERAIALDACFARAYAGLSFTHFQNSLLEYVEDVSDADRRAEHYSRQSLEHDPVDPFANLTMGRCLLLRGDLDGSIPWLERAIALNPNYAQAKYSRAWSQILLGEGQSGQSNVDTAMALSPLDPFHYAMLSMRGLSHLVLDELEEAANWTERAAKAPGAHCLTQLTAVAALGMADQNASAERWSTSVRQRAPDLTTDGYLRVFRFRDPKTRQLVRETLERFGF